MSRQQKGTDARQYTLAGRRFLFITESMEPNGQASLLRVIIKISLNEDDRCSLISGTGG